MTECSDGSSSDSDEDKAVKCRKISDTRKKITIVTSCQTITTKRHRDAETSSEEGSTSADTPVSQTDTSSSASFSCFSSHVLAEINGTEEKSFDADKGSEFNEEVSDRLVKKKDKKKKKRKSERDLGFDETPDACDGSGSPDTRTGEPIKEKKAKKSKKKADPQGESQEAEEPDGEPCFSEVRGEPEAAGAEEVGEKKKKKKKRRREATEDEIHEDGDEVQVDEKFSKQKRKKKNKESS